MYLEVEKSDNELIGFPNVDYNKEVAQEAFEDLVKDYGGMPTIDLYKNEGDEALYDAGNNVTIQLTKLD